MNLLFIIAALFLSVLSVIDLKTFNKKNGNIPAFLSTAFILVMYGISQNTYVLLFSALMALLLTELDVWSGIADFKVFIASALSFGSIYQVLFFIGLLIMITPLVKLCILYFVKNIKKQIPLIPIILVEFILAYGLIGILKII